MTGSPKSWYDYVNSIECRKRRNAISNYKIELESRQLLEGLVGAQKSRALACRFDSLHSIALADDYELSGSDVKLSAPQIKRLRSAFNLARKLQNEKLDRLTEIRHTDDVIPHLREDYRLLDHERLMVTLIGSHHEFKGNHVISDGGLRKVSIDLHEIFTTAIRENCPNIILSHNHPRGSARPSGSDIKLTKSVVDAGKLLNINLLDHVIFARPYKYKAKDYLSMRAAGYFERLDRL